MRARRLELLDEYREGGEAVVFVEGQVVALSALATTALLSVGTAWTEAAVVAAALVAKFGDPPPGTDALAATHHALVSLAESGIVELQYAPSDHEAPSVANPELSLRQTPHPAERSGM